MHLYKGVRSCPIKTYYILTNGKINLNQLYLSLVHGHCVCACVQVCVCTWTLCVCVCVCVCVCMYACVCLVSIKFVPCQLHIKSTKSHNW